MIGPRLHIAAKALALALGFLFVVAPASPAHAAPPESPAPDSPTPDSPTPAAPAPEAPTTVACDSGPIVARAVLGCGPTCKGHHSLNALLALAPLGAPLTAADQTRILARVADAKLASKAALGCTPAANGNTLVLTVDPMTFVRRVRVSGNDAFRRKDILKRIFLRAGTPLDLDRERPLENELVKRQIESLERLYRQSGLDEAKITVLVTTVDESLIDLEFLIREGLRTRIDSVDVAHLHRGLPDPDGLACPTIDPRPLERLVGLGTGDVWTRIVERQVRDRLRKAFQSAGFERPRITLEPPTGQRGTLLVTVETDRCWLVRVWRRDLPGEARDTSLSFRWVDPIHAPATGRIPSSFTRVPLPEWTDALPFGESGSFDRDEAVRGIAQLSAELRARGFPFAEVALTHRDLSRRADRRTQETEVVGVIDYLLTLNLERRLQGVRFEGREAFSEQEVTGLMKTVAYDFFGASGAYDEGRVLADLAAIESHYRDRGHFAFRFRPPTSRGADYLLYRHGEEARPFALEKHPSSPHLTLVIAFDEGPRTDLGVVTSTGSTLLDPPALQALTGLTHGAAFGPVPLRQGLEKLVRFYRQRGFHRLQIRTTCRSEGLEVPCDGKGLAVPGEVDLTIALDEGPVVRVGAVVWRGNAETDPHVLVRDLPKPGDILDFDRINLAVRKMRALNIFNSVRVDAEGLDDPDEEVEEVEEEEEEEVAKKPVTTAPSDPAPNPDAPDAPTPPRPKALRPPRDVVLVVTVEEADPRFLDIALGLRSIGRANIGRVPAWAASGAGAFVDQADRVTSGFGRAFALDIPDLLLTFDFEYNDLNSLGIGNQLRIPFDAGFSISQFLRQASFNPSYTFPRVFDTDLKLVLRGIAELDRVTDPLDRLELGLESDLLVPLSDTMLAGLSARAGIVQLETPDADCVYCLSGPPIGLGSNLPQQGAETAADILACAGDPDAPGCSDKGFRPQFTLSLRWRLDTQDTPLHPTRGFLLSASTSFILDRDRLSSAPVFNQFVKWETSLRAAFSVQSVVFAAFLRYGGAATFDEPFLPADERFTLGGSNGVRGFSDNGICRYDSDGQLDPTCPSEFGGNVLVQGSFELRVPLLMSAGLWLGAFMDFGGLARSHEELYVASLRVSSGFGIRWLLGGLFPVRIDLGFPLFSRRCIAFTEEGGCLREEPSQVHFGLLYTF